MGEKKYYVCIIYDGVITQISKEFETLEDAMEFVQLCQAPVVVLETAWECER